MENMVEFELDYNVVIIVEYLDTTHNITIEPKPYSYGHMVCLFISANITMITIMSVATATRRTNMFHF